MNASASNPWSFPGCPEPPDWSLDWDTLVARFAWLRALAACPQDARFHAEGDVLRHTGMVCAALVALPAWRALDARARSIVFAAALLHDAAKPACTVIAGERITSHGHAVRGALLARNLLWRAETAASETPLAPLAIRNAIVALVRHHHLPVNLLEQPTPQRALFAASQTARCDWLALLSEADVRGRICDDQRDLLDRIALFREYAQEQACLDAPRAFPSDHSRFLYFRREDRDPDYLAYDDTRCEVALLSGLPGAGKSAWRQTHLPHLPVISLDALRAEMGAPSHGDQGSVLARARELARGHLRAGEPFVWDATNITRALRDPLIDLFSGYGARVRIVYVEAPRRALLRRNSERAARVPESVIERLAARLQVPDLTEAHTVEWVEDGQHVQA